MEPSCRNTPLSAAIAASLTAFCHRHGQHQHQDAHQHEYPTTTITATVSAFATTAVAKALRYAAAAGAAAAAATTTTTAATTTMTTTTTILLLLLPPLLLQSLVHPRRVLNPIYPQAHLTKLFHTPKHPAKPGITYTPERPRMLNAP